MNLQIIFEDAHIIVCHKKAGQPVQTAKIGLPDMVSQLHNYLKKPYIGIIHRLDQPVEGLIVFAKTKEAAKEMSRNLQTHQFGKYYKAVLCNIPKEKEGRLEDYLKKDGRTNTSHVCLPSETDAKKAVLFYETEMVYDEGEESLSLVKIRLETGRHHQIRVQMANLGCPIWGDTKYNPFEKKEKGWNSIALCAYRLEFVHPKTKENMVFEIEPEGEGFQRFRI